MKCRIRIFLQEVDEEAYTRASQVLHQKRSDLKKKIEDLLKPGVAGRRRARTSRRLTKFGSNTAPQNNPHGDDQRKERDNRKSDDYQLPRSEPKSLPMTIQTSI